MMHYTNDGMCAFFDQLNKFRAPFCERRTNRFNMSIFFTNSSTVSVLYFGTEVTKIDFKKCHLYSWSTGSLSCVLHTVQRPVRAPGL